MTTKLGTLTLDLVARIGSFTQGMRQASTTAEREMGRVQNSVVTVDGLIKKLAVTAGAVFSVGQIINAADEYTQMAAQISNATSSQLEYDKVQKHLLETANTTYRSLKEAQQVYLDIGGALKAYGVNTDKALRITDSLSFSFTHNATATDKAKSATDAYMKSVYEGTVSGDSWRGMLSAIPSIVDDMSASLGKSKDEILTLGNAGKFTSTQLNDSFDKSREKSEELANAMSNSLKDGAQVLINAFSVLAGEANMTYGVTNKMAEGLGILAENLDGVVKVAGVGAVFMAGTYIPMVVKGTYATISDTVSKVANITASRAKAVADLDVAKSNLAATAAMVRAMGVTNAQTAAMMTNARAAYQQAAAAKAVAFSGAGLSSVLLGPVGVGVALASVAAGYLLMKDNADKATTSIEYQGQKLEDLVVKYRELNILQRDNETKALSEQVEELSLKFKVAASDLSAFIGALPASDEKIAFLEKLTREFQNGRISSDAYYESVKNANFLSDKQLDKVRDLIGRHKESKQALDGAKNAQDALSLSTGKTTEEVKKQATETAELNAELKKLFDQANQNLKNSQVTIALADRGYNDDMIALAQKYLAVEGAIVKNEQGKKVLRDDLKKLLKAEYDAIMGAKNAVDGRNKSEEKTKKLIEAQGAAMKVNAKVAANAAKYNFASIESKNNLPAGLLSAIHMQESKGDPSAYNKSSGATGGFQFLKATADQYGVKNRNDLAQSAEGAGKYMAYLLKLFKGDLDKAVSAYHAGEGNVQHGTNIGPVNRQYVKNIKGYMGGASGVSFTEDYSFDEWVKEQEKIAIERENQAQKQREIQVEYYNDWQKLEAGNQEKIKEIQKNFANDTTERDRLLGLRAEAYEVDVGNWLKAQDEKVAAERETNKQILAERYKLVNASLAMQDQIKNLSSGAEDINARASMSPQAYAEWSLSNNRSNAQLDLKNQRVGVEQDIMTSDLYSNDDDRYAALLEAHQEYRDGLAAIDVAYDQQVKDLAQSQYESQLGLWGNLLGQAQNTWSQMTQAVKDSEGEQSGSFKTMFLMQQAFSMGSALVSAHLAATQVAADATIPFFGAKILASKAMLAMGYANVGMIAGQTIAGMAHDGIDNIPREGTWLLDKGERVVDSRTNGDLKDYLAKGGGSGGNVTINQSINIASDGTATTQNDSKQLGVLINNAVLAVIRKEQRQGGLLSK